MTEAFDKAVEYREHRIHARRPGFEYTPVLFGKIASFVVSLPGEAGYAAAAFMYPLLPPPHAPDEDDAKLMDEALAAIKARIDWGLGDREELTFQRTDGAWVEHPGARWWIGLP